MAKIEINFYQIDDVLAKSIAPLMLKVLEERKKALILCQNSQKMKEIDDGLWQFGKVKFIPHVTVFEKDIEEVSTWQRQPIVISDEEKNINEANYLVLTQNSSLEFIEKFERTFYFFDSMMIDEVKKFSKTCAKDFAVKSYKKDDGKWVEFKF